MVHVTQSELSKRQSHESEGLICETGSNVSPSNCSHVHAYILYRAGLCCRVAPPPPPPQPQDSEQQVTHTHTYSKWPCYSRGGGGLTFSRHFSILSRAMSFFCTLSSPPTHPSPSSPSPSPLSPYSRVL